jgi:hypothetical protein
MEGRGKGERHQGEGGWCITMEGGQTEVGERPYGWGRGVGDRDRERRADGPTG